MTSTPILFTETSIGKLALKNRLAVAPMTRISASAEGLATDDMTRYYTRFARGGYGLLITEGVYPDVRHSQGYLYQPGIGNDAQARAWRKVIEGVHAEGAKIFVQLMHAGALSQGSHWSTETIGPSAVQPVGEQMSFYRGKGAYPIPREITPDEITQLIQDFADAAARAKAVGFDGIEIHGANGYILDQFLTAYTNQREDRYGGATENRVRLLVEVSQAVRHAVGPEFPVGIRISQGKVNDFVHKWGNGVDDASVIFGNLGKAGLDYIHVTEYDATQPGFGTGPALVELAKRYAGLPIIANGQLEEPAKAAALLATGTVDVIALGKGALADRDWPQKVLRNEPLTEFDNALLQPLAHIKPSEI